MATAVLYFAVKSRKARIINEGAKRKWWEVNSKHGSGGCDHYYIRTCREPLTNEGCGLILHY